MVDVTHREPLNLNLILYKIQLSQRQIHLDFQGDCLMIEEYDAQILNKLGLTFREATVYLALAKTGKTSVQTISKSSNIDRSSVYKTLCKLHQKGLVEQTIAFPNLYKAVPLHDGILFLLELHKQEERKLEKKASLLLQKVSCSSEMDTKEKAPQFILIPEKRQAVSKSKTELSNIRYSLDFFTTARRYSQVVGYRFRNLKRLTERGAHVRVLLIKPTNCSTDNFSEDTKKKTEALLANPKFELKFAKSALIQAFEIYDNERAAVAINPMLNPAESTSIWTNHPCVVAALKNHFEIEWSQTKEHRQPREAKCPEKSFSPSN